LADDFLLFIFRPQLLVQVCKYIAQKDSHRPLLILEIDEIYGFLKC
jgi:hypothetical protein